MIYSNPGSPSEARLRNRLFTGWTLGGSADIAINPN
jgi:hypothetical protein